MSSSSFPETSKGSPLSPAEWTGVLALSMALLAALSGHFSWAAAILALFVLLCICMPFFPASSFYIPVISRGECHQRQQVCLTFDDGPDPRSTPELLALLHRHQVPAAFFVTGQQAERFPRLLGEIVAAGHCLGNHSYSHDKYIMFRAPSTIARDIARAQQVLANQGIEPLLFRPPVGIVTARYRPALHGTRLRIATFSRRGRDMGNRRITGLAARIVSGVQAGDIIMLHDVLPRWGNSVADWLREVEAVITGCRQRGLELVSLEELLGMAVMRRLVSSSPVARSQSAPISPIQMRTS